MGWAPTKAAGQRGRVARHGAGRGKQPGLPGEGVTSTPGHVGGSTHGDGWHVVGAGWRVGDEVTRSSTMQDTLSPGEGCNHLNT